MPDTLQPPDKRLPNGLSWAELVDRLAVPLDRIRRAPIPGTANEDDFMYANEQLGKSCELIDGTLVEMAMGSYESLIAAYLISLLWSFVRPRKLGVVLGADSMFRLFGGNIRMPDLAYIPKEQFPNGLPPGSVWTLAPSLVVEVLSASNTPAEIKRKRAEFFAHGVLVIWIVDPISRTVTVFDASDQTDGKQAGEILDATPVLPGFVVKLSDLFGVMDS